MCYLPIDEEETFEEEKLRLDEDRPDIKECIDCGRVGIQSIKDFESKRPYMCPKCQRSWL